MEQNGSFSGNVSGGSFGNFSTEPISSQSGYYNNKRSYGNQVGGWIAFALFIIGCVVFILLAN